MRSVKIVLLIMSGVALFLFEAIDFTEWLRKLGNYNDDKSIYSNIDKKDAVLDERNTALQTTQWFACGCPTPIQDQNMDLIYNDNDPESDSGVVYYSPNDWYIQSQDILREIQDSRLPGKRLDDY